MASALTQTYETVRLVDVSTHPENPRQGDVGAIHASIIANGFYGALVVQKSSGRILAGNHRYLAAREAGLTELPAVIVDVDDAAALRILLADNRTNDLASYDEAVLATILAGLDDLTGTGYTLDDFDDLKHRLEVPVFAEAAEDEQGKLDERKQLTCPSCGHMFAPGDTPG